MNIQVHISLAMVPNNDFPFHLQLQEDYIIQINYSQETDYELISIKSVYNKNDYGKKTKEHEKIRTSQAAA